MATGDLTIRKFYSALVPLSDAVALLAGECDVKRVAQFAKAVEAAKKIDNENQQRQNYWGELAIWSARRLGQLIQDGQDAGKIAKRGHNQHTLAGGNTALLPLSDLGIDKMQSSRAKAIADIPEERIREYVAEAQEKGDEISKAGLQRTVGHDSRAIHVSQNTGQPEWYTPPEYIAAARKTLGAIDLDPASSMVAQKVVKASVFYSVSHDGLSKEWNGRIWLNPPYAAGIVDRFVGKLVEHYTAGDVTAAVLLTNNATDTQWWQSAARHAACTCFPLGRIRFLDEQGNASGAPLQGQSRLYFGRAVKRFRGAFEGFGVICDV